MRASTGPEAAGTGERLGLAWWVAVPLDGPEGSPAAIWGFGGRDGGRPVPSEEAIRALARSYRPRTS